MIETAKRTGVGASESTLRPAEASAAGKATAMESTGAIEIVVIDENPAVGDVGAAVEHDPVIMPVISPVSPPPAKTAKEADSKAEPKRNSRTIEE
jgi:hypothetical protein